MLSLPTTLGRAAEGIRLLGGFLRVVGVVAVPVVVVGGDTPTG
jgi:hypothetical protein